MTAPATVETLVLARLLAAPARGETPAALAKDLKPFVEHRWTGPAWGDVLARSLDGLEGVGAVARVAGPPARGKKPAAPAPRFALTDPGRRLALERLGLEALPAGMTWAKLRATYLVALALGVAPADAPRLSNAGNVKAELLNTVYGLGLTRPTLPQATGALVRKLLADLGVAVAAGHAAPTMKAVQDALFRRELGAPAAKTPLDLLAARGVGARQSSAAELAAAALRTWLGRSGDPETAPDDSAGPPAAPPPADLAALALRVQGAARGCPSGWFGDAKVFISHVWRALRDQPDFFGMDPGTFKGLLVRAHNARLIELGRADLVEAMDPDDVRESATPHLNAVYHFVRTEDHAR